VFLVSYIIHSVSVTFRFVVWPTMSCCADRSKCRHVTLIIIEWFNASQSTVCHYNEKRSHTLSRLTALCPGLPGWAGTSKVKPIWILLKQETVSGSGIRWAICKSALRSRQITMPAPHHSVFTGRMPFLSPNQQCQSTEGTMRNGHLTV